MNIKQFVEEMILSSVSRVDFDMPQLANGIDAYIEDNGFHALEDRFEDTVIKNVISNNLAVLLSRPAEEIVLYFSNYGLIERIRLINNRSLKLANEKRHGKDIENSDSVDELEAELENCLREVYRIKGLQNILQTQISEIILNLDYANNSSSGLSQRLSNLEVTGR